MLDALRGYVQLASGLTEVTFGKAKDAVSALLSQGIDLDKIPDVPGKDTAATTAKMAASQVQDMADELMATSQQNRELLVGLIRTEVDRAAGRLGFVREEELAAVRRHVSRLESQLTEVRASLAKDSGASSSPSAQDESTPAARPVKKKVPVKRPAQPAADAASGEGEQA